MHLEADISGHQRKIADAWVRPVRAAHGDSGIALRAGRTLPFSVIRLWNAPAGYYYEAWYLIDPDTREVVYEGPENYVRIWGLQSVTEASDRMDTPIGLEPGTYAIVFALGGVKGGEIIVEATEASGEAA